MPSGPKGFGILDHDRARCYGPYACGIHRVLGRDSSPELAHHIVEEQLALLESPA